ncbi:CDP-alcohol phosphatidyltransferase family protein [Riemerella columbina]|uniref:CDP-alcohol phosphatidyltransferase family protein n=1 Tax=Riemerella columbina TaxID=103810 RepID=UPI00037191BD|nr:CDP-alcohol phosphatidyltransferase family protein [Riemerella columbina]
MTFIKNNLANAFTLGNLFSGCVGAIHLIQGDYQTTAICIIISLVLDFFDGFVARALKSNSDLGVQLDSLADMVSFGLVPGLTMFKMLEPFGNEIMGVHLPFDTAYLGLLITLGSCLRLAIFNIDDDQKFYFKGLNTPSNAIMIFGLYYAYKTVGAYAFITEHLGLLLLLTLVSSWLLISPIKMIAMKFKSKQLKDNYPKLILLIGSIILILALKITAIPLVIIYYILVSLFTFRKKELH